MPPTTEIQDRIEHFVRTEFDIGPSANGFGVHADLYEDGYVDSIGFVELLYFVKAEFDVDITEEDLLSEEFSTIAGIAGVVARIAAA